MDVVQSDAGWLEQTRGSRFQEGHTLRPTAEEAGLTKGDQNNLSIQVTIR